MKKSFYQMLQLVEGNITNQYDLNQYDPSIDSILYSIQDEQQKKLISIMFALHCAQDCFYIIPPNNDLKPLSRNCMNLTQSWLIDSDSVNISNLENYSYDIEMHISDNSEIYYGFSDNVRYAALSAAEMAKTVYKDNENFNSVNTATYRSASYAANAKTYNEFPNIPANDYLRNNKYEQYLQEYTNYLSRIIHTNIQFDEDKEKYQFINYIKTKGNPNSWDYNNWLYFLLQLKDEFDIPIITQYNNNWRINPNLGHYNISLNDQNELIHAIASNNQFKSLRNMLYNKIVSNKT